MSEDDRAGEFGPIYLPALQRIRDCWLELEPLVDNTAYDDVVAPTELQISLADGIDDADATEDVSRLDTATNPYTPKACHRKLLTVLKERVSRAESD
jgi:hypothetical protein